LEGLEVIFFSMDNIAKAVNLSSLIVERKNVFMRFLRRERSLCLRRCHRNSNNDFEELKSGGEYIMKVVFNYEF
jgi:hypothetical protein